MGCHKESPRPYKGWMIQGRNFWNQAQLENSFLNTELGQIGTRKLQQILN